MPRRISLHEKVAEDIESIVQYIAFDGPQPSFEKALEVEDAIIGTLRRIGNNPERCPPYVDPEHHFPHLRRCLVHPFQSYVVVYQLTDTEVRILHVFGVAQNQSEQIRAQRRV